MFYDMPRNVLRHSPEYLATFPGMFYNIPRNVLRHSPKCLRTFPGMLEYIPQNVWRHPPECLRTLLGIFGNIPQNVWGHSPECLATFPGMFGDIPRNVWGHSPECLAEYNIPPIPHVPHILFPIPIFLFLYTARFRETASEVFLRKGVIKICSKFIGEKPCQGAISEITLRLGCSPVNLLNIFRTSF